MSTENEMKAAVDRLLSGLEKNGVVVSSVKDGHLLIFKRQKLIDILEQNPQETLSILVQTAILN